MNDKPQLQIIPDATLFKWIGGKSWLKSELREITHQILQRKPEIDTYVEPFMGGLGAFLGVADTLLKHNINSIILNDLNPLLVHIMKTIRDPEHCEDIKKQFVQINQGLIIKIPTKVISPQRKKILFQDFKFSKENAKEEKVWVKNKLEKAQRYFLKQRKKFNNKKLNNELDNEIVALFLFIMNHCFNGVYRENNQGEYNVGYNWATKPQQESRKLLLIDQWHTFLNQFNITFSNEDAITLLNQAKNKNALFYLDPPYLNHKNGVIMQQYENSYSKEGFNLNDQILLVEATMEKDHFIYSNHDAPLLINTFKGINKNKINTKIIARHNIMSAGCRANKINEMIVFSKY